MGEIGSEIRLLRAEEIDCRISTVSKNGCSLLLYKDARVDQNILDETFGRLNWQRHHRLIGSNLYCTVSVWDESKQQWIEKEDVGVESYAEKEKGQASDSFKRACFNLGIGRELYTAPFIWISKDHVKLIEQNGKVTTRDKFYVKDIRYDDKRNIVSLMIADKYGNVVFQYGHTDQEARSGPAPSKPCIGEAHILSLTNACAKYGIKQETISRLYSVDHINELSIKKYQNIMDNLDKIKANQDEFEKEIQEAFPE